MKSIKTLAFALIFIPSASFVSAEGSFYTDLIGVTKFSDGTKASTNAIGITNFSDGGTSYTDAIGNTHYTLSGGVTGTSYTDAIGNTYITFSDGTKITAYKDQIGNTYYKDQNGRTGMSYKNAIGVTHYSGDLFPNNCPFYQVYDSYVNKCVMKGFTSSINSQKLSCTESQAKEILIKYNLENRSNVIKDLKNKLATLDKERELIPIEINKEYSGRGATSAGIDSIIRSRLTENFNKTTLLKIELEEKYASYLSDLDNAKKECSVLGEILAKQAQMRNEELKKPASVVQDCGQGYVLLNGVCSLPVTQTCSTNAASVNGKCQCNQGFILDNSNNCVVQKSAQVSFKRSLKKGVTGQDVKQLQELLIKNGYLPATHTPSTYFGTVTSNAVIKFQKDNAITPANGSFGPLTQKKLLSASEKPKVVTEPAQVISTQNQVATTSTIYDDNLKTDLYGATIVITTSPNYKMVNIVNATKNGVPGRFNKSEKTFISDEELYRQSKQTEIEIQKINAR